MQHIQALIVFTTTLILFALGMLWLCVSISIPVNTSLAIVFLASLALGINL